MRNTVQRLLASVLAVVMLITLLPLQSSAARLHTQEQASSAATRSISAGSYVIAAKVGDIYYALNNSFTMSSGKILGEQITVTNGAVSDAVAASYAVTIAASGSNFTISNGSKYLKYSSSTNLATDTLPYEWTISTGTNGSYRIASATTTTRAIIFSAGSLNRFGAYVTSNASAGSTSYYDVELLSIGGGNSGETTDGVVSTVSIANGDYVIAAKVGGTYYAMSDTFASKITGTAITVTDGKVASEEAEGYRVKITASGSYYTISNGSNYLSYVSGTNLGSSTSAYNWAIIPGVNGTYRAVASSDNTRGLVFQNTTDTTRFGGYSLSNATAGATDYYDIEILPISDDSGEEEDTTDALKIADGDYVIAAFVNGTYYAMGNYFESKIPGTGITVTNGCVATENAEDYIVSIAANGDYYTIKNDAGYLRYTSSTNLGYSASDAYEWSITQGVNGSYRIVAAATLGASTVRALSYRADTYQTFGAYAASNLTNNSEDYFDIELLPVGDPADYVKSTFTLVESAANVTAGDYVIVSQAINSNNAFYAMTTSQRSGYYYMISERLDAAELPQTITLNKKDRANFVWTMSGSRTSFKLINSAGTYLANSSSAARLNLSSTATTWAASAYSTTKHGFYISANNYYISLRDDSATYGANGNPMFGSVAVASNPAGHIYMNLYKACAHSSVTETAMPATCIESGTSSSTCNTCGTVISWTSYPATGHSIIYTPNTDATHTISCETCGYEEGTSNCIYSNLSCYLCGNHEPENDYSGRYYFATVRSAEGSTYHYMTFDLVGASTRRYASEDSGLTTLPSVITAPISNKVYVIEKNEEGTYRIFAEGLAGDNCLAWEADANASENSGAFADTFNAYELTIGLSGEATNGNKIVNIYFVENDLPRYLSLNNTTSNNYFAWYTNASSQRKDIVLLPVVGEAICLHTNQTTVTTEATCTTNGVETIYCSDCGAIVGENELLSSGHALQYQWVEEGWHYAFCTNCDYSITEECTIIGVACMYCSGGDLECFQLVTNRADLTTDRYVIISQAIQGPYVGDYTYYGLGLQQDSNHNALSTYGMNFDAIPDEIYLEGSDTANLVWDLTGTASGFTLTTDSSQSLYHNTGNDLLLGAYTATTWTADFSATGGYFAVKHNNAYYLSLRTDLNTLDDTDIYSPLVNCVNNTNTGNYRMLFYKKYDGCLHINTTTTIVEPTCTTGGSEVVVCQDCHQTISSITLEAYGHDPFAYAATEPTCTQSGNLAYWYCADCDCYFADELCSKKTTPEAIAIAAFGHSWDDGQISVSPTCTETGTMLYTCYICTGTRTEVIAAAGHFYTLVVTAPTCTEQGYATHTCSGCGDSYTSNFTEPFGHSYTYTNNYNGTHVAVCNNGCGYNATENCTYTNNVCACGAVAQTQCTHTSTSTTTVNATCTQSGSVSVICNSCGKTISTTVLPATGHSITEVAAKAATCTQSGCNKHWYCTNCKGYFADATGRYALPESFVIIAALGHEYVYTNSGSTHTISCSRACGYSVSEAHSYKDGTCVCGAVESSGPSEILDTSLSFIMNISAGAEVQVLYTVMASKVSSFEHFYLVVTKSVADGTIETTTFGIEDGMTEMKLITNASTGAVTVYQAIYTGINAKNMGDVFSATLYAVKADGTICYGNTQSSSIKSYLIEKIDDRNSMDEMRTMAVDMLNYGAAAQVRLGYDMENLVNADLTAAQLAYATKTVPAATDYTASSGSGKRLVSNVSLQSKVMLYINCVYTITDTSDMYFIIKDAKTGSALARISATVLNSGKLCQAIYDNVGARDMRKLITIELYDGDTLVSQKLTWSVESYVASVRAKEGATEAEIAMVDAMLTYGDAVAAYLTVTGQ